jgi:hypothetical protein
VFVGASSGFHPGGAPPCLGVSRRLRLCRGALQACASREASERARGASHFAAARGALLGGEWGAPLKPSSPLPMTVLRGGLVPEPSVDALTATPAPAKDLGMGNRRCDSPAAAVATRGGASPFGVGAGRRARDPPSTPGEPLSGRPVSFLRLSVRPRKNARGDANPVDSSGILDLGPPRARWSVLTSLGPSRDPVGSSACNADAESARILLSIDERRRSCSSAWCGSPR